VRALKETELPVTGTRGWNQAEATAGGVPLSEVHLDTMESRIRPGLFLCGEMLDVDGRIGGYNFQWAWATGHLAGQRV
jgi:predicted flavoprotein YhiN